MSHALPTELAWLCVEKILSERSKDNEGRFLLGCQTQSSESRFHFVGFYWVAKPSRNLSLISSFFLFFVFFFFLFFSVSVKVLPVTPLLSSVFVHRAFYAYFLRIERVVGNA